jgi:hypothetical protein
VFEKHGAELDSLRADAELMFTANPKTALTDMRTSNDLLNDRTLIVVQGNKRAAIVTLHFDQETVLLTRQVRSTPSPVGRLPRQDRLFGIKGRQRPENAVQMDDDLAGRPVEFRDREVSDDRRHRRDSTAGGLEALLSWLVVSSLALGSGR